MPIWDLWPWSRNRDTTEEAEAEDSYAITPQHEADLIAAASAGNEEAFARIVRAHQGNVLRLAYRVVRDREDALEIAQDVFVTAWQNLSQFRGDARLSTWLYTITYRRALRAVEARRQRSEALQRFADEQAERADTAWSSLQASVAEEHWQQIIRDQIEHLPARYREIIALRHLQDLSYEEIAQRQTIPVNTVKTHLFRARQMLRDRLEALDLATLQQGLRDRLPHIGLPHVEFPHVEMPHVEMPHVEMPHPYVEMPQVDLPTIDLQGAAQLIRGRIDQVVASASGLGEVLRGHLQEVSHNLGSLGDQVGKAMQRRNTPDDAKTSSD